MKRAPAELAEWMTLYIAKQETTCRSDVCFTDGIPINAYNLLRVAGRLWRRRRLRPRSRCFCFAFKFKWAAYTDRFTKLLCWTLIFFSNFLSFFLHLNHHPQEKPHKCSLCSKSFPTPGDLKSHMYVHSGSWPFKCHICSRGFSKQTNLKNHLFLHTGKRSSISRATYR